MQAALPTKRFTPRELREFRGGALHYRATALAFVTTGEVGEVGRDFAEQEYEGQPAIVLVTRDDLTAWTERRTVPPTLAALLPASPEPAPEPEPQPPPRFPHLKIAVLVLISLAALTGSDLLEGAPGPYGLWAFTAGTVALGLLPVVWARYRWRWYWWRRSVNELWPGWHAPRWPGSPARRLAGFEDPLEAYWPGAEPDPA